MPAIKLSILTNAEGAEINPIICTFAPVVEPEPENPGFGWAQVESGRAFFWHLLGGVGGKGWIQQGFLLIFPTGGGNPFLVTVPVVRLGETILRGARAGFVLHRCLCSGLSFLGGKSGT